MEIVRQLRKVLIICEESSARDTMRVLLGSMGCQCVVASTVQQAIAVLEQENPDAAIVDPRSSGFSAASILSEFDKIYPSLRGRVVVLSGNESAPEIKDLLQRYSLPRVSRDRLLQLQPMPAGVRGARLPDRRLVYQSESLMADLWLEPQSDSQRIALVGQIVDPARFDCQFDSIPVVLHGSKGAIALTTANKFGEFHFNFEFEPSVTLEIEVRGNHWVSIALPGLEWAQRAAFADS